MDRHNMDTAHRPPQYENSRTERRSFLFSLLAVILALLLLGYGVLIGQVQAVWGKAARICLECIGIG